MALLGYELPELARLQLELEYGLTRDGLLVPREDSPDRDRCCVYVHAAGAEPFFRFDVPADAQRSVRGLTRDEILAVPALLSERLGGTGVTRYETYLVLEPFAAAVFPDAHLVAGKAAVDAPDGTEASWAWSIRESGRAAECAVGTAEGFRRRGLASQVTAAWANRVLADGKVPFYSHAAANDGSRAVAARLALTHVFTVLGVSE